MSLRAHSVVTGAASSFETGRDVGLRLAASFGGTPPLVLVYLTVNHDQSAFLGGVRDVLGSRARIVGCSAQGVIGRGDVMEEGFAAGAMALGGDSVSFAHGMVEDIAASPFEKGSELGRQLRAELPKPPNFVVLHYDALCGVNPDRFMEGLFREVECPIVGGAAGQSFSYQSLLETYSYHDGRVFSRGASAFAMCGDFGVELGSSQGCSPVGVEFTVTRVDNNLICELDGRPAAEVWSEICGELTSDVKQSAALAIGIPADGVAGHEYFVRAAYALDPSSGNVNLGPAIPAGTRIMLHHRTVEDIRDGTRRMADELKARIGARRPRVALGFECGARTAPFLGREATLAENLELQRAFDDDVVWLGMLPWGELFPVAGKPRYHNYTYPLLVLVD